MQPSSSNANGFFYRMISKSGSKYINIWDFLIRFGGTFCAWSGIYYCYLSIDFNPEQLRHLIILCITVVLFIDVPRTAIYTRKKSLLTSKFLNRIKDGEPTSDIPVQDLWNEATGFPLKISQNLFFSYLDTVIPCELLIILYEGLPFIEGVKLFIGGLLVTTTLQLFYFFAWEIALRPVWQLILNTGGKLEVGAEQANKINLSRKMKIGFIAIICISLLLSGTLGYYKLREAVQAVSSGSNPEMVVSSFTTQSIIIASITLLLVLSLSLILSRSVSIPLQVMNKGIKEVAQGNLDTRLEILSNDELGYLGQAFNGMIAKLQESMDQIKQQNFKLKELDRLKSEFLANTSHELRTPINGITGLVESILDGADGPINDNVRQHLRMINECGQGLRGLVDNLLDLTKIMVGQGELKIKKVNLKSLLNLVLPLGKGLIKDKPLSLTTEIAEDLPEVYIDQDKIWQVLMNLLGNAVKFTRQGGVKIGARSIDDTMTSIGRAFQPYRAGQECPAYGKMVLVYVSDTGIGIRPEDQEIIFEEFRQLDGSASREYGGAGLGLSIARKILARHNCSIWVESAPGQGSTFYFTLPTETGQISAPANAVVVQDFSPTPKCEITIPSGADLKVCTTYTDKAYDLKKDEKYESGKSGQGEVILVVDDNPVNIEVVKTRLELNNYKVIGVGDSLDGLKVAMEGKVDLIILDLMMPKMTGYEFCQQVREHSPYIPIIMLTAKSTTGDLIYGLNLGASDYISKPFNKEELVARVGALLRLRRLQKKLQQTNQELTTLNGKLEQKVKERTRDLEAANSELRKLDQKKSEFLSVISHELRTPITSIKAFSEILMEEIDNEAVRKHLEIVNAESERLTRLVSDLLKFSRLQLDKETFNLQHIDISKVIKEAVCSVTPLLKEKGLNIQEDIQGDIPPTLSDRDKLIQVMDNLLGNAIKFSPPRSNIRLVVKRIGKNNGNNGGLKISVIDEGPGIAPEYQSEIFQKFGIATNPPPGIAHGTGLGLAISREIIHRLGGNIGVESTLGKGSTFYFTLPERMNSEG